MSGTPPFRSNPPHPAKQASSIPSIPAFHYSPLPSYLTFSTLPTQRTTTIALETQHTALVSKPSGNPSIFSDLLPGLSFEVHHRRAQLFSIRLPAPTFDHTASPSQFQSRSLLIFFPLRLCVPKFPSRTAKPIAISCNCRRRPIDNPIPNLKDQRVERQDSLYRYRSSSSTIGTVRRVYCRISVNCSSALSGPMFHHV